LGIIGNYFAKGHVFLSNFPGFFFGKYWGKKTCPFAKARQLAGGENGHASVALKRSVWQSIC
jgi:hypothetical protein